MRGSTVLRGRLLDMMDRAIEREMVVVSGPAGSGKSILVASWVHVHANTSDDVIAWVSLDHADSDPVRLWTSIGQALETTTVADVATELVGALRTPDPDINGEVDGLLARLAAKENQRVVLVLDDLHRVEAPHALASLARAVEHLPSSVRIIATSRHRSSARLSRLRAHGFLSEIRAPDLAFRVDEAVTMLNQQVDATVALTGADVAALVHATEGWAAGLGLALMASSTNRATVQDLKELSGRQLEVAEYLVAEVLDATEPTQRDLLRKLAVLPRFTDALCKHLHLLPLASASLADIAETNLFVVPLDQYGQWYRYHHLFRDVLLSELARNDPDQVHELQRQAALWFEEQGEFVEALELLGASGDYEQLLRILSRRYVDLHNADRTALVVSWIERIPPATLARHAFMTAIAGMSAAMIGRPAAVWNRFLNLAEENLPHLRDTVRANTESAILATRTAQPHDNIDDAVRDGQRAVELGRAGVALGLPGSLQLLAYAQYLRGDSEEARATLEELESGADAGSQPIVQVRSHAVHALLEIEAGTLERAESWARMAVGLTHDFGISEAWSAGFAHLALGQVLLEQGHVKEAERECMRAETLLRVPDPRLDHVHALLILCRARIAAGKFVLARSELTTAQDLLRRYRNAGRLSALANEVDDALTARMQQGADILEAPTPAELPILRLLATDLSQREIGQELFVSINTVKTHTRNLYRKLGVDTRECAVARAREVALI